MNNSNKTTREENNNVDLLQREIFRMQTQLTRKDIEVDELKEENKLLRESNERMKEALEGVIRVADRKTVEFDKAKAALQGNKI